MALKYLKQRSVNEDFRITLPNQVRKDLYPNEEYDETKVYWNIDEKYNDIIISTEWLKNDPTEFKKTVKTNRTGGNDEDNEDDENDGSVTIVVEKQVRNAFDISLGDDLYFIAPEGVSDLRPATFIWTFEKIEDIILSGDDDDLGDFPRRPEF